MAKTSKIYRERQREETVAKYAERRAEYKRDSVNPHLSAEEREEAMRKLVDHSRRIAGQRAPLTRHPRLNEQLAISNW